MQEAKKVDTSPAGIRAMRKRLRMTQAELAVRLGYSRNYVTLLETGAKPVTDEVAYKLTALLTPGAESICAARAAPAPAMPPALVRESSTPYAVSGCRIPADCDLPAQLADLRAEMAGMRGKLDTLLSLLGGPLRSAIGLDKGGETKRAG